MSYTMLLMRQDDITVGYAVEQLVIKALRYKPECRRFDYRWYHWHNPSVRNLASNRNETVQPSTYATQQTKFVIQRRCLLASSHSVCDRRRNEYGTQTEWYWQGTSTWSDKPVPMPLCVPQIRHGLTRHWTLASAIIWRITDLVSYTGNVKKFADLCQS